MKGSDLVFELGLTLQEVASGTSKLVTFQHQGRSEKIFARASFIFTVREIA